MNQRVVTGLLAVGCIALAGAGYMTYKGQDRTAPKITVDKTEKLTYTEGDAYDSLLKGVTAEDDKDGNLTGQVFVDKVVPVSKKKAVVYYGVTDKANNVGTAQREVSYVETAKTGSDTTDETATDASADTAKQEENTSKKTKTKKAKSKKKEETLQEPAVEDTKSEDQQAATFQPNGNRPAIKLVEEAKTIARGTTFNPLSEVEDAVDDKDDRDTLFRGLHVDGEYNVNQAGTYTLQYYVQDSEGNASDPVTFTLTVQ